MAFWIAYADSNGNRIAGSELMLTPGPSSVDYPAENAGSVIETPSGRVVQQLPAADARRRAWIWSGYPADHPSYERIWAELQFLRSRWRFENSLSPYIYVKDSASGQMLHRTWVNRTTSGAATLVFSSPGATWTVNEFAGCRVVFPTLGYRGVILSNTVDTFTLQTAVPSVPNGTTFIIHKDAANWVRVRVLELSRELRQGGGNPVYENTRMVFTIDDPNFESVR